MTDNSSLLNELRKLEERLTNPEVRRSPGELALLLADDFREFGSSGRIFDKSQIIAELQNQVPCNISLTDFEAARLAENLVLVTYRATVIVGSSAAPLHSLRSSLWRRRYGQWEVVFHQGTPSGASTTNLKDNK